MADYNGKISAVEDTAPLDDDYDVNIRLAGSGWFMTLEDPTPAQAGLVSVVTGAMTGAFAVWFTRRTAVMERTCEKWDDLILTIKMRIREIEKRLVGERTTMPRPRIRQFAGDMGISYDQAKGLINEGRRRKDGNRSIGEQHEQDAWI